MAFARYFLVVPLESSSSSLKPHHPIIASSKISHLDIGSIPIHTKSPAVSLAHNFKKVCNFSIFPSLLHRIAAHKGDSFL